MLNRFYSRHSFHTILLVVFLLPLVGFGALQAVRSQRNNVEEWLPEGYTETAELSWFRNHFLGEQFALLSWEGCDRGDVRLHVLAKKLVPDTDIPPSPDYPPLFKSVVTGASAVDQLTAPPLNLDEDEAVERLQDALIKIHAVPEGEEGLPHEQTCLIVTLTRYGKEHLTDAIGMIQQRAEESGLSNDKLHMGGPPIDNHAIDTEGRKTLRNLAGWSGLIGLALAYWCFRSIRLTMMVFSIGACSAITSLGIVGYYGMYEVYFLGLSQPAFGGVDAVLLSMPSVVYVLAISGAIHIINYYRDAVEEIGEEPAVARAITHAWAPCTLAAATTAVGLASLCISDLVPIKKFGFWSAMGVLATLGILFTMLPAWLKLWPPKITPDPDPEPENLAAQGGLFQSLGQWLTAMIIRRNGRVAIGCTALLIFFAVGLTQMTTSVQLLKLFDPGTKIIADYTWLEKNLGNLVPMEIVLRVDQASELSYYDRMNLVSEVQHEIEQMEHVSKTMSLVTFAPKMPEQKDFKKRSVVRIFGGSPTYQYNKACQIYSSRIEAHRDEFLASDYLSEDENEELWRISCRVSALNDVDYGEFVHDLRSVVDPVVQRHQEQGHEGLDVTYTGVVPLVYKSQNELLNGLIKSTGAAFLLIAVVMIFVLRSIPAGLISMLPNVFPIVVVFGLLSWLGVAIDIGTMMTASVAMGVAVDDTVHFLTWFRHGMRELGLNRQEATKLAYRRCARAMMQTTAVSGLGLLIFALSSFTPTQRFGYMMFLLLAAALVGDLIFLPALLTGPIGRFFGDHFRRTHPSKATPTDHRATPSPPPPHIAPKTGSPMPDARLYR